MKRRGLFLGLSFLLAAVTVGSILTAPATSRLRAIPAHAQVIYNKQSPENLFSAFPTLNRDSDEFSTILKSLFRTLEHDPLTVAVVPFGGRARRDTWVAVSELGGPAATALRWRLMLFAPSGVVPARSYAVWPVWKIEDSSFPSWVKVRFAVTESLLICSISSDSHDIYRLLDVADGRSASLAKR